MTPPALALALLLGGAGVVDTIPEAPLVPTAASTAASVAASVAATPAADRWLAEDKLQHFALSFATVQMGYGGGRVVFDRETAVPLAAGVALLLGVGKEVRDARTGGHFSLKDLAWDLAGVALAVAFVRRIE